MTDLTFSQAEKWKFMCIKPREVSDGLKKWSELNNTKYPASHRPLGYARIENDQPRWKIKDKKQNTRY